MIWLLGGTSTDAAAGLAIDLAAARALQVPARFAVTAVTAQDERAVEEIYKVPLAAQSEVLLRGPKPLAIKSGLFGAAEAARLRERTGARWICDPVLRAGSGHIFVDEIPLNSDLLTPNLPEAAALLGHPIVDVPAAARELLARGAREVLIKGGHRLDDFCDDYWTDGTREVVLRSPRQAVGRTHGTGCLLAAALAAGWAQGLSTVDALARAKALLNRGLRLAHARFGRAFPLELPDWPQHATVEDMPWIPAPAMPAFPDCGGPLGFYPIVDRAAWLPRLAPQGVTTIQLRIKDLRGEALRAEIETAVSLSRRLNMRLFVNDYWPLALELGAYGVHLGQGDLESADLPELARAGIRLGVSTHNYQEVARAHGLRPSYVAIGPIFPTTLKAMPYPPQGIAALARWRRLLPYPLVAIGGLTLSHASQLREAGADGIAVVSDVLSHPDPQGRTRAWCEAFAESA